MHTTLTTLAIAAATTTALAGVIPGTVYDNRAEFSINTGALNLETFEDEALGDVALPTAFASGLAADFTSGSVSSIIEAGDPDDYGFLNTTAGGRKYLRFGRNIPVAGAPSMPESGSYSVSFYTGAAVNAFGFDLSGFQPNDAANGFNVTLFNNGQVTADFFVASDQLFGAVEFYGFVMDESFDEFRINIPVLGLDGAADYTAFDDIVWGVPTPGATTLLALAALTTTRRRRN
jgi:MYXO-CTERM domain-containing protein